MYNSLFPADREIRLSLGGAIGFVLFGCLSNSESLKHALRATWTLNLLSLIYEKAFSINPIRSFRSVCLNILFTYESAKEDLVSKSFRERVSGCQREFPLTLQKE